MKKFLMILLCAGSLFAACGTTQTGQEVISDTTQTEMVQKDTTITTDTIRRDTTTRDTMRRDTL